MKGGGGGGGGVIGKIKQFIGHVQESRKGSCKISAGPWW